MNLAPLDTAQVSKPNRLWERLGRLGLLLGSLLIALLLLEGLARLVYARQQSAASQTDYLALYRPDDVLEWTHLAGSSLIVDTGEGPVSITINSHGLRDSEYPYQKPPGTFRILVLGDSFTEAMQVELEDTYHAIAERRLNEAANTSVEVISAGTAAYGTLRSMIFYEQEGRRYQPDLVILAFYMGNDMQDDHPALAQHEVFPGIYRQQFFLLDEQGRLQEIRQAEPEAVPGATQAQARAASPIARLDARLFSASRLYFYLRPFLAEQVPFIRRTLYRLGWVASPAPLVPRYAESEAALFESAWQIEAALIARLRADVEADGATLAVLLIPDALQIQPEFLAEDYPLFYPAMLDDMDFERTDRALMSILDEQGIPYLRLYPLFVEQRAATGQDFYGASSRHWNQAGHRLAADALVEWLLDRGFLPIHGGGG